MLWKESGEQCPYTGDKIGFDDLFSGNPRFEVEHIWPRSKSLDNSMRNKTLCRKDVNHSQGQSDSHSNFSGKTRRLASRERPHLENGWQGRMAEGKAKRFCAEVDARRFRKPPTQRHRLCRAAGDRNFSSGFGRMSGRRRRCMFSPSPVKVTAQLRRRWGLNYILADDGEKTRADHRHHAIDALVVACADGGYTQKLSRYFESESDYRRGRGAKPDDAIVDPPWANIRADAERTVAEIVVSHRVRKKVSGPLHMEMIYGDTGVDETTKSGTYRLFVTRKPLDAIDRRPRSKTFVDDRVREIVRDWVSSHGGDPKKAFAAKPRVSEGGPEIRKVRLAQQAAAYADGASFDGLRGRRAKSSYRHLPRGRMTR